jgi:hypothetical protein
MDYNQSCSGSDLVIYRSCLLIFYSKVIVISQPALRIVTPFHLPLSLLS